MMSYISDARTSTGMNESFTKVGQVFGSHWYHIGESLAVHPSRTHDVGESHKEQKTDQYCASIAYSEEVQKSDGAREANSLMWLSSVANFTPPHRSFLMASLLYS
jgi:hypothetical protein